MRGEGSMGGERERGIRGEVATKGTKWGEYTHGWALREGRTREGKGL